MVGKSTIVDLTHTLSEPVAISEQPRTGVAGEVEKQTLGGTEASTQIEIDSLRRQIADLQANSQEFRRRMALTPGIEEEYNDLMTKKTNTLAKYNDLMGKLMEAKVATGLEKEQKGERFTLIEPPRLPTKPFKPNRLAIMAIGVVLGIGAGVGFGLGGLTGIALWDATCGSCDPQYAEGFLEVGMLGALAGGLVGALVGSATMREQW